MIIETNNATYRIYESTVHKGSLNFVCFPVNNDFFPTFDVWVKKGDSGYKFIFETKNPASISLFMNDFSLFKKYIDEFK